MGFCSPVVLLEFAMTNERLRLPNSKMTILKIYKTISPVLFAWLSFNCSPAAYCQGSPLPGSPALTPPAAPVPVSNLPAAQTPVPQVPANSYAAAPVPGNHNAGYNSSPIGASQKLLPISVQTASVRLEELRNLMHTMQPKEFQESLALYLDWLAEMADGHWRLSQSMGKQESLKKQAEWEKQLAFKLGSLKRQAMLLKAEFLIRQGRQPEALGPLVDIVVSEPKTGTGQAAYQLLKDIGFSEEPSAIETSSVVP